MRPSMARIFSAERSGSASGASPAMTYRSSSATVPSGSWPISLRRSPCTDRGSVPAGASGSVCTVVANTVRGVSSWL